MGFVREEKCRESAPALGTQRLLLAAEVSDRRVQVAVKGALPGTLRMKDRRSQLGGTTGRRGVGQALVRAVDGTDDPSEELRQVLEVGVGLPPRRGGASVFERHPLVGLEHEDREVQRVTEKREDIGREGRVGRVSEEVVHARIVPASASPIAPGASVMIVATPSATRSRASDGSFTVQTPTRRPRAR